MRQACHSAQDWLKGASPESAAFAAGRDHWPFCYSAMVAGGGMRGGLVHGASDKSGGYVESDPVSPEDFGATLYHALGIPPETRFGPNGFSEQVSAGRPVLELLKLSSARFATRLNSLF